MQQQYVRALGAKCYHMNEHNVEFNIVGVNDCAAYIKNLLRSIFII
jgi:hypothetical protein